DINQAVFKNLSTLQNQVLSVHDFTNATDKGNASLQVDLDEISDEDWKKAQQKYLAIKPLIGGGYDNYIGEQGYERRAKEVGVSSRTLKRWVKSYQSTNSIGSLLDKKRGWRSGQTRISSQMNKLINELINDYYLTNQRQNMQSTIREVYKRCHQLSYEKTSANTIRRRIKSISEEKLLKGRGQRKKAKQKFTPKAGQFP